MEGGEVTYERIVAAAAGLFIKQGYDGTAMSQVAKSSGVTTPALYWHFQSKEALYSTVVERGYASFGEQLNCRTVGGSARQRLTAYVQAFVAMRLRDPEVSMQYGFQQLRAALPQDKQADLDAVEARWHERLEQVLSDGCADGEFSVDDVGLTATAVITMCEYVFTWYRPDGALSAGDVGDLYAEFACALAGSGRPQGS
jgi:AcrR family transcriptional regulator